jgi:hypothetical protein
MGIIRIAFPASGIFYLATGISFKYPIVVATL